MSRRPLPWARVSLRASSSRLCVTRARLLRFFSPTHSMRTSIIAARVGAAVRMASASLRMPLTVYVAPLEAIVGHIARWFGGGGSHMPLLAGAGAGPAPMPAPAPATVWDGILLAAPKKKVSHSRKAMRMANKGLKDRTSMSPANRPCPLPGLRAAQAPAPPLCALLRRHLAAAQAATCAIVIVVYLSYSAPLGRVAASSANMQIWPNAIAACLHRWRYAACTPRRRERAPCTDTSAIAWDNLCCAGHRARYAFGNPACV